jgi:hypothetical protein
MSKDEVEIGDVVSWNNPNVTAEHARAPWQNVVVTKIIGTSISVMGNHGIPGSWDKAHNNLVSKKAPPEPTDQELADSFRLHRRTQYELALELQKRGYRLSYKNTNQTSFTPANKFLDTTVEWKITKTVTPEPIVTVL